MYIKKIKEEKRKAPTDTWANLHGLLKPPFLTYHISAVTEKHAGASKSGISVLRDIHCLTLYLPNPNYTNSKSLCTCPLGTQPHVSGCASGRT